jgi:hypothetical protein
MKSYRFLGEEAEVLGTRLDAARMSLAESQTVWAKNYWSQTVEQLLFQWRQLPILHDADAQVTIIPRWTVSYNFYERSEEGGAGLYNGISDRAYNMVFRKSADLDASWENHRAARLARAQF